MELNNNRNGRQIRMPGKLSQKLRELNRNEYISIVQQFYGLKTANRQVDKAATLGIVADAPKSGANPKITDEELQIIDAYIDDKDGLFNRTDLLNDIGIDVTTETLSKYIHKLGYFNFKRIKCQFLNADHKRTRLIFAQSRIQWTIDQWKRVIFSDECAFRKMYFGADKRVWRKVGDYSKDSAFLHTQQGDSGVLTHVYGAMSLFGPGLLLFLDGNLDGSGYMRMLRTSVRPYMLDVLTALDEMHEDGFDLNEYLILADDNASPHSSHEVTELFGSLGIRSICWPPYSPDLNLIEHIWAELKKRVYNNGTRTFRSKEEIEPVIEEHFWAIQREVFTTDYINNLYSSMPRRLQKIIEKDGAAFK